MLRLRSSIPKGLILVTKYDPNRKIPKLTPETSLRISNRHDALWKEPTDKGLTHAGRFKVAEDRLTDAEWFEVLFIAAIFAAAVDNPLRTVGDAWKPIVTWLAKDHPRVKGWSEAKMQQHIAAAADKVIRLMSV